MEWPHYLSAITVLMMCSTASPAEEEPLTSTPPDPSEELYDPAQLPHFRLTLPEASLEQLHAVQSTRDPTRKTYVRATFTYGEEGKREILHHVGVRIKGEGSFQPLRSKPALKLKFDKFVSGQRFRGLKRLTLNNNYDDPTFLAERLAYAVYRDVGVPAPRCNNALVTINETFYGVYTNIETEDRTFLKRWFEDASGNLYEKDGYGDFLPKHASDFDLETNEEENDRSDLTELLQTIEAATDKDTYLDDLAKVVDTERLVKFMAVEGLVNQWDSLSFPLWWVHNLRLYHDPQSDQFVFIPWGHDLCLKPALFTGRRYIRMFERTRRSDRPTGQVMASILFRRCLESPTGRQAYREAIQEAVQTWQGLDMVTSAETYYRQIKPWVARDQRKVTEKGPLTHAQFEAAYQQLLTTLQGRLAAVHEDLRAE